MPLLDHFHPPLSEERHWEGFHSKWANSLVDHLNEEWLPPGFFAEPQVRRANMVEIDVTESWDRPAHGETATLPVRVWAPRAPTIVMPAAVPDTFEVRVVHTEAGPTLVAAIEFVSPGNMDRPDTRRTLAIKCASYLCQGVSLILVDVVTNRRANLHDEIMQLLPGGQPFAAAASL